MINWIFPIAGLGTRTKKHGQYKPFIDIAGKTMIERCIDNLRSKFSSEDEFYFVTTDAFNKEFDVERKLFSLLQNFKIKTVILPATPPGQAYSVKAAVDVIENDNMCIVINCDQLTLFDIPQIRLIDVAMPLYFTNHGKSCYVSIDEANNNIIDVREKLMVSYHASSGTFIFGSKQILGECIYYGIDHEKEFQVNNELYLGPCINYLIKYWDAPWDKPKVIPVTTYMKIDLGTDEQIDKYLAYLKTLTINGYSNYESHGHYE